MIELGSIDTGNPKRDAHLRGPDFLDVETGATMSYRSTGLRRSERGWVVDGELTLRAVTAPVPLDLTVSGFGAAADGEQVVAFAAAGKINRRDFGVTVAMDAGGALVSRSVAITLEIKAVRRR